jgi:hypothetical protein
VALPFLAPALRREGVERHGDLATPHGDGAPLPLFGAGLHGDGAGLPLFRTALCGGRAPLLLSGVKLVSASARRDLTHSSTTHTRDAQRDMRRPSP